MSNVPSGAYAAQWHGISAQQITDLKSNSQFVYKQFQRSRNQLGQMSSQTAQMLAVKLIESRSSLQINELINMNIQNQK